MEKRAIYIVLTQTDTIPARLIRFYTKEPFAHASLALDENLDEMYSFARKGLHNPLNGGFIQEHPDQGVLGRCKNAHCCIYQLMVTPEQYTSIRRVIDDFKRNQDLYNYHFLGILGVILHIPIHIEFSYFCSQFVATVLKQSHIHILNKNCALVRPADFRVNPHLTPVYSGLLADFRAS